MDGNDLEKDSYCTNLPDPGRLAIPPDYGKDMKSLARKLDLNTFYQVGKYNHTIKQECMCVIGFCNVYILNIFCILFFILNQACLLINNNACFVVMENG